MIGENGQGKTSFLEAVYYLCFFSSFQSVKEEHIMKQGTNFFSLSGELVSDTITHTVQIQYHQTKKKIEINKKQIIDRSEVIGEYLSVIFKHSDILLIQSDPQIRRNFMDQTLCLTSKTYMKAYKTYRRLLRQKNSALKQQQYDMVEILNEQLVDAGIVLIQERKKMLGFFRKGIIKHIPDYLGNALDIELQYEETWNDAPVQEIVQQIRALSEQEKRYKTSLSGPHRDRFEIYSQGVVAKQRLSVGQCRYFVLLLRLLQSQYIHHKKGRSPIFLFDDVFLELDTTRRERFLQSLPPIEQAIFTFLPEESLPFLHGYNKKAYHVANGVVTPQRTL